MPDTPEMTLEFTSIETAELARLKARIAELTEQANAAYAPYQERVLAVRDEVNKVTAEREALRAENARLQARGDELAAALEHSIVDSKTILGLADAIWKAAGETGEWQILGDIEEAVKALKTQVIEANNRCELEKIKLNDRDRTFDRMLNDLWQLLYPGKTDWEYPGQVYNHIRVEIERGRTALKGNQ